MLRSLLVGVITILLCCSAWALYGISFGNQPVTDEHWPAGSAALANLPSRFAHASGDPGDSIFAYSGDTAAFQAAVDLLAKLTAPEVRLIVHGGANPRSMFAGVPAGNNGRNSAKKEDWTFTVFNPAAFNRRQAMFADLAPKRPMPSPSIDLFLEKTSKIDFAAIKVPANIKIIDERADSNATAGSIIRGQVLDMITSKPIPDAQIVLEKRNQEALKWESADQARSTAEGAFEFKNVPVSSYRLNVSASGRATRIADYIQILDSTSKQTVVQLSPVVAIKGKVVDTEGAPIAGVSVKASGSVGADNMEYRQPEDAPPAITDALGNFSLDGPQGTSRMRATRDGYYQLDSRDATTAPADAVTIRMTRTGTVKATVVDRLGNPAPGDAMVEIRGSPNPVGRWGGSLSLMPGGIFEFKNVPPGEYLVSTGPSPDVANDPNAKKIEVKVGETTEITIEQRARVTQTSPGSRRISPVP